MTASKTPFLFPTDTIAYVALILSWIRIEAFDRLQSPCELPAAFGSSFGDFAHREFWRVFNSVNNPKLSGLLLRLPAGAAVAFSGVAEKSLRAAGVAFEIKPLFKTSGVGRTASQIGVTSGGDWEWHIARPKVSVDGASPWELAHAAVANRLGLSAETEMFVEPDLEQEWIYENPVARDAMAAAADACVFNDQIGKLPGLPGHFAWHLSSDFSQLKTARDAVGDNPNGQAIRIVHLTRVLMPITKHFQKTCGSIFSGTSWTTRPVMMLMILLLVVC